MGCQTNELAWLCVSNPDDAVSAAKEDGASEGGQRVGGQFRRTQETRVDASKGSRRGRKESENVMERDQSEAERASGGAKVGVVG